jgi:hypothetical protein
VSPTSLPRTQPSCRVRKLSLSPPTSRPPFLIMDVTDFPRLPSTGFLGCYARPGK